VCIIEAMKVMNEIKLKSKASSRRFWWKTPNRWNSASRCSKCGRPDFSHRNIRLILFAFTESPSFEKILVPIAAKLLFGSFALAKS